MMMKQKNSLGERLNIGDEVRELKLGCTFNSKNTTNAFHTIKYDFKPASVDKNRVATVDVGSNNQVTVTVPNLVSSGVPHTIYKGNQKKYTKECILIYDKRTGDITLEKLNHNIQVKKTRSEMTNKPSVPIPSSMPAMTASSVPVAAAAAAAPAGPAPRLENSTMRISSKTKVSTGNRKNTIIELKSRNSPMQGSPSAGINASRSPQSAPAWNANNGQATLPSIPMIVDDDDSIFSIGGGGSGGGAGGGGGGFNNLANVSASSSSSTSSHHNNSGQEFDFQQLLQSAVSPTKQSKQSSHNSNNQKRHNNHQRHQQQQQQSSQQQSLQTQQQPHGQQWQQQLQHQQQQTQNPYNRYNGNGNSSSSSSLFSNNHSNNLQNSNHNNNTNSYHNNYDLASSPTLASEAAALEQNIASDLSSSSSSSESESSGSESGSDSDDSTEDDRPTRAAAAQMMNQLPNLGIGPMTTSSSPQMHYGQQNNHNHLSSSSNNHNTNINNSSSSSNHLHSETNNQNSIGNFGFNDGFPNDLLQNDLQLSSNSSDDDSD